MVADALALHTKTIIAATSSGVANRWRMDDGRAVAKNSRSAPAASVPSHRGLHPLDGAAVDRHLRVLLREGAGGREADAGGGAGDQGTLSLQSEIHTPAG